MAAVLRRVTQQTWNEDRSLRTVYCGKVDVHGRRQGRGELQLYSVMQADAASHRSNSTDSDAESDDDDDDSEQEKQPEEETLQAVYRGIYVDDKLQGRGELAFPQQDLVLQGEFDENDEICSGAGNTVEAELSTGRIVYRGKYVASQRHGQGQLFLEDGGMVDGLFVDGEFVREKCIYQYPTSSIRIPIPSVQIASLAECLPDETDALETERVLVAESPMPGAGEGLFARTHVQAGWLLSLYAGNLVPDADVQRYPAWEMRKNAIWLDRGMDLDVPSPFDSTTRYQASLGHKANHTFDPARRNARYSHVWHPRFGHIRSVEAIRDIPAGEEILVSYDYSTAESPPWYLSLQSGHFIR